LEPPNTVRDALSWYGKKEKLWLARHPERKELSSKEVQRRKSHMKGLRGGEER